MSLGSDDNKSKWDCPVCLQVPRRNIFQCSNGHAICDSCSAQIGQCPICRSRQVKIRNRLAEDLLDVMKFPCSWKEQGCLEVLKRQDLALHEDKCGFNSKDYKLCSLFSTSKTCTYTINPIKLRSSSYRNQFISHAAASHRYTFKNDAQYDTLYRNTLKTSHFKRFFPRLFKFGSTETGSSSDPLYLATVLSDLQDNERYITWVIVHLTPEIESLKLNITIKPHEKSKLVAKWGSQSVPSLTWSVKSIHLAEFTVLLDKIKAKTEDRFNYPFWLPISLLQRHYLDETGKLELFQCFEK